MSKPQPQPMRLIPGHPPNHSYRKARPYVGEVRRLRAEGYTLESIRLALLDAGVSVSRSTVSRAAARPLGQRELEREQAVEFFIDELRLTDATGPVTPLTQLREAPSSLPAGPTSDMPAPARIEAANDRKASGVVSRFFRVLRSLGRGRRPR